MKPIAVARRYTEIPKTGGIFCVERIEFSYGPWFTDDLENVLYAFPQAHVFWEFGGSAFCGILGTGFDGYTKIALVLT